jgi:hypothetical protein
MLNTYHAGEPAADAGGANLLAERLAAAFGVANHHGDATTVARRREGLDAERLSIGAREGQHVLRAKRRRQRH